MKNLQVLIKFRDNSSQTLQRNVATGEKIDLAVLHQNILTLQKETNDILTAEVENEKRTNSTSMNSHGTDNDDDAGEEDDDEDNDEPPEKQQKR